MAIIRSLIPKKLTLIKVSWENKSGVSYSYRARIWQPLLQKKVEISLKSRDENDACQEAFEVFSKYAADITEGNDIASRKKKLKFYIDGFLKTQEARVRDKQITPKRLIVVEHNLKSLIEFSKIHKNPPLDRLSLLYDNSFQEWRSPHTAKLTGKTLSIRYRNSEMSAHKQFFHWAVSKGYCNRLIQTETLKVERTNFPFPREYYNKLLSVARADIIKAKNARIAWEQMNYRTVIMLMNGIGCRVVETKNLKWNDLKIKQNFATLYIQGKGKERTIQIPDRILGYFENLRAFKKRFGKDWWNEKDYPYIFNSWKSPTTSNQYDARSRRRWMKEAGVEKPEDYELVCFRHKFITDQLNKGTHSLPLANYTGTSQAMIEKTYSGLVSSDVFNLVFRNDNPEALERAKLPQWLETKITD